LIEIGLLGTDAPRKLRHAAPLRHVVFAWCRCLTPTTVHAPMPSLFLAAFARLIVVLHAATAIVLVGAATHHAVVSLGYLRGTFKVRLARIYAATVAVAWLVTFVLGLVAYPTFRYAVRALYMDRYEPWASNLFDIKEHLAALGIPIVLGVFALSRVVEPKADRGLARAYAALTCMVAAIVWFDVVSGLVITMVKGV
jgi:hypothetical protein